MNYSFEQIKLYLTELLEKFCEPELSIWLNGHEYVIILYKEYCEFIRCGSDSKGLNFNSLDELYSSEVFDGIILKNTWNKIGKIECTDFDYLNLPTEIINM